MDESDWDQAAARFEEEIFNVPANDRRNLIKDAVGRFAAPDARAADVGCGTGRTIPLLAAHFSEVHGLDISSECLRIASHRNRRRAHITFHHADLVARPLPCPQVDLALCINTLLLASRAKRKRMFHHLCGVLKPGGHLLLVVPSIESVLFTHHMHRRWRDRIARPGDRPGKTIPGEQVHDGIVLIDRVPTKHYLKEEVVDLLGAEGLEVLEVQKIEYPWSTEFVAPPRWMRGSGPWDWFVTAVRPV